MRVVRQMSDAPRGAGPLALAIGVFDGVHVGHRAVIRAAQRRVGRVWVLTFEPHPLQVVRPDTAPPAILSQDGKLRRLASLGVEGCIVQPFTVEYAATPPMDFLAGIWRQLPDLRAIAVGEGWRFGRGGAGDAACLAAFAAGRGIEIDLTPPVVVDGTAVSSTRIRQAVLAGDLAAAARLLGDEFTVDGIVARGRGIGRRLGFPTANLDLPPGRLLPPPGVYAAVVSRADGRRQGGAVYIGDRPTFAEGGGPVVEVHLLDEDGDLYGERIEVRFLRRLRGDAAFPDAAALRAQIEIDVAEIRRALSGVHIDRRDAGH